MSPGSVSMGMMVSESVWHRDFWLCLRRGEKAAEHLPTDAALLMTPGLEEEKLQAERGDQPGAH